MIADEQENVENHAGRSLRVLDKAIDRVRKLLALAKGTNEHEAALAASNAAKLIEQFQLTEAMIRIDEPEAKPEPIEQSARLEPDLPQWRKGGLVDGKWVNRKRIAWKETIAEALASDLGIHMYYRNKIDMCGFGRESAIQTWRYTYQYLCRAVDELADKAWEREGGDAGARGWKNAFRVGCAQRLSTRIYEAREARKKEQKRHVEDVARTAKEALTIAVEAANAHSDNESEQAADVAAMDEVEARRECMALAIVEHDQAEVDSEYKEYSKGWRKGGIKSIGSTSSYDGYESGQRAGGKIALGGKRVGLPAGQGRLRGRS